LNKVLSKINIALTFLFLIFLTLTFLYKDVMVSIHLSQTESWVILMTMISLILMISFLQTHLSLPWRIFCLAASFVTLIESILMLGAWEKLLK